jgi:hypothetical protein
LEHAYEREIRVVFITSVRKPERNRPFENCGYRRKGVIRTLQYSGMKCAEVA